MVTQHWPVCDCHKNASYVCAAWDGKGCQVINLITPEKLDSCNPKTCGYSQQRQPSETYRVFVLGKPLSQAEKDTVAAQSRKEANNDNPLGDTIPNKASEARKDTDRENESHTKLHKRRARGTGHLFEV